MKIFTLLNIFFMFTSGLFLSAQTLVPTDIQPQNVKPCAQIILVNTSSIPDGFYIGSLLDGANVIYSNRFVVSHK